MEFCSSSCCSELLSGGPLRFLLGPTQWASNFPKLTPKKTRRLLSPTKLARSCVRGTRCVRSVEE